MKTWLPCLLVLAVWSRPLHTAKAQSQNANTTVIFATGFEKSEGYDDQLILVGQNGWMNFGSGGNGLVTNFFDGLGQQAFIGLTGPTNSADTFSLLRPFNFVADTTHQPIVKFSVLMSITESSSTNRDDFRWSVYNLAQQRLFSLDFDGVTHGVNYALDDGAGFFSTGVGFTNLVIYELAITMNFTRNLWSASLNNLPVVNSKPISTRFDTVLNLADIDAVWSIRTPGQAGDNYLLFDEYVVTAEALPSIPPTLEAVQRLAAGQFLLKLHGELGLKYAIDASSDLVHWTEIKTLHATDGTADFLDNAATNFTSQFYRARQIP
ncbi:MAG: hypothetical protein HY043_21440 [Verrucomicrobia bacterium]|nr:hypothetical protein [Verrucomicrobiota bacterium]